MAREIVPAVERAVGLAFKRPPVVAVRSREQVRTYLNRKMAEDCRRPSWRASPAPIAPSASSPIPSTCAA